MTLPDVELPKSYEVADRFSLTGQHRTLRGVSARLILTLTASIMLAIAPLWVITPAGDREYEPVGVVAALLFFVAFGYEVWLLKVRPERDWYDGRAVAESAKTLSWRYAVGALPYPLDGQAVTSVSSDVHALTTDIPDLRNAVAEGHVVTAWMEQLRRSPLEIRRDTYLAERIRDQECWYSRKAAFNAGRARAWARGLLIGEVLGAGLALAKSVALIDIDLASILAATIACGAAWLGVKQHESIATAYRLASLELATIHQELAEVASEDEWSVRAADAEEAISREHTMWRASRSVPSPGGTPRR